VDKFFFGIKDQIYQTIVLTIAFYQKIPVLPALVVLATVTFVFFRRWELRKVISLIVTLLVLSIIYARIENFFLHAAMSAEGADMAVSITRIITGIIAVLVFIYHASVSQ
jgi:hypothetical protein